MGAIVAIDVLVQPTISTSSSPLSSISTSSLAIAPQFSLAFTFHEGIALVQPQVAVAQKLDNQALAAAIKAATVVINGQNPGSGVIIGQEGNTYYVLTAKHVVATQDEYEIITSDGAKYTLDYRTVKKLPGVDLALVQFTSDQSYSVAQLGNSDAVREGATIYISGWPHPGPILTERIYQLTMGTMSGRPLQPLQDGYALVYTNITRSGMSGGPILDAQGRVIGIHGRADGEPVFNPETGKTVNVKSGFNLGIPIRPYFDITVPPNKPPVTVYFKPLKTLNHSSNPVSSVAISPDGQTLASGSYDGTIKLWNSSTGKLRSTLTGHSDKVYYVAISPDGQTLVSRSADGTIKVWDLRASKLKSTLTGHSDTKYYATAFSPDGQTLASGDDDGNIKLWNTSTGELRNTLKGHSYQVISIVFSPDGQTLASAGVRQSKDTTGVPYYTNIVEIWDLGTGKQRNTFTGYSDLFAQVVSIVISPDGKTLALGKSNGEIAIVDVGTGKVRNTVEWYSIYANNLDIEYVTISPDGQNIAAVNLDGKIKLWNLHTGEELRTFPKGSSVVAFSPDGQTLISGNADGTIKIWPVAKP